MLIVRHLGTPNSLFPMASPGCVIQYFTKTFAQMSVLCHMYSTAKNSLNMRFKTHFKKRVHNSHENHTHSRGFFCCFDFLGLHKAYFENNFVNQLTR